MQQECQTSTGLGDDKLANLRKTGKIDECDKTVLNFLYCLAIKANFIDEKGNVKLNVVNKHLKSFGVSVDVQMKAYTKCNGMTKPKDVPKLEARYHTCYLQFVTKEALLI